MHNTPLEATTQEKKNRFKGILQQNNTHSNFDGTQ